MNRDFKTDVISQIFYEKDVYHQFLHEIGHILCGHFKQDKGNILLKIPSREKENLSINQSEFEAEKVCEIVSRMLGIECNTENYLKDYLGDDGNEPSYSLRIIIEAADKIIKYF